MASSAYHDGISAAFADAADALPTVDDDSPGSRLIRWASPATCRGSPSIRIEPHPTAGNSLVTTRAVPAGSPVLSVSQSVILDACAALCDPAVSSAVATLSTHCATHIMPDAVPILLALCRAAHSGAASFYAPYVAMLPVEVGFTLMHAQLKCDCVQVLAAGTPLAECTLHMQAALRHAIHTVCTLLSVEWCTPQRLAWAHENFTSRAMRVPLYFNAHALALRRRLCAPRDDDDVSSSSSSSSRFELEVMHVPAMVPLADVANHAPGALLYFTCDTGVRVVASDSACSRDAQPEGYLLLSSFTPAAVRRAVTHAAPLCSVHDLGRDTAQVHLVSGRSTPAGAHVWVNYGAKSSASLLLYFGFLLPPSIAMDDSIRVQVEPDGSMRCAAAVDVPEHRDATCVTLHRAAPCLQLLDLYARVGGGVGLRLELNDAVDAACAAMTRLRERLAAQPRYACAADAQCSRWAATLCAYRESVLALLEAQVTELREAVEQPPMLFTS